MPELPEVEIHARNLRRWLVGKRIGECRVLDPLLAAGEAAAEIEAGARDCEVLAVRRTANHLYSVRPAPSGSVASGRFRSLRSTSKRS